MRKLLGSLAVVLIVSGLSFAASSRFTETLPPAVTLGYVPVSNGFDWSLSSGTAGTIPAIALNAPIGLFYETKAQVLASTATAVGQIVFCTDCVASKLCVSTGTATALQWAVVGGTATATVAGTTVVLSCQ